MDKKSLYSVLNCDENASKEELKKQYKKLSLKVSVFLKIVFNLIDLNVRHIPTKVSQKIVMTFIRSIEPSKS